VLFKFASLASQTGDLGRCGLGARAHAADQRRSARACASSWASSIIVSGSYEVARTYLESALKSPNLPAEVRSRAQQFMADVEGKEKPSHFSGDLFLGWRYQSNANLGPATSNILLFGQIASLNQAAVGTSDWGVVSSAQDPSHPTTLAGRTSRRSRPSSAPYVNRQFTANVANVHAARPDVGAALPDLQTASSRMSA